MQRGDEMRTLSPEHPNHKRDLTNVDEFGCGRKRRADAKTSSSTAVEPEPTVIKQGKKLQTQKRKHPWRAHQSMAYVDPDGTRHRCCYDDCPGRREQKGKRPFFTVMRCEECSIESGCNMFFCNSIKNGKAYHCHTAHHNKHHKKKFKSDGVDE